MVKTQGGDTSDHRFRYNVCTVIRASDTDFEDGSIDLPGRSMNVRDREMMNTDTQRQERVKRDEGHHTEVRWFR